jgi:hypothetical protein
MVGRYTTAAQGTDRALMRRAVRSYWKLVDLITDGDADRAARHWEQQLTWVMTESRERLLDVYESPPRPD